MTNRSVRRGTCSIILTLACLAGIAQRPSRADSGLEQSFVSPPASARPWVYWFWMNGNITKEGITADLEAMQRVGIGGVLLMNATQGGIPKGPVHFMTPSWRDLFRHTAAEANRLGLEITMNNDDGWMGSGGPWIQPDQAMQTLTWSETAAAGPGSFAGLLAQPQTKLDTYREIAVLAIPAAAGLASPAKKSVGRNAAVWKQLEFAEPQTVGAVTVVARPKGRPSRCELQASDDGKTFHSVCSFSTGWPARMAVYPTVTIGFEAATARYFRLLSFSSPGNSVEDVDFALDAESRVSYWRIKAGFDQIREHGGEARFLAEQGKLPDVDAGACIPVDRVIDLSDRMKPDGSLEWDIPPGKWTILRLGYTPTGRRNAPATEEGVGLDCDKLDPRGIEAQFPPMLGKLLGDVGQLAGKTFSHAHIDSWELGHQNWSARFPEEFKKRRGYDLRPWLPVMAGGRVIGGFEASERFLWDVRRTLADLIADNYLARMRQLCHQAGIQFQAEASGRQQFLYDPIQYQRNSDLPMGEFWFGSPVPRVDCKVASSVAHLYGTVLAGAEAFTAGGPAARWQETPGRLKPLGDLAFCMGINRFFLTEYTHQPWLDRRPGMTLGPWGAHLERTQTWWEPGAAWMKYTARCQSLLQQGQFVGDVCYLLGEGAPAYLGTRDELSVALPAGYDYDGCDPPSVMKMSVDDGRLVAAHGTSYRVLLLPAGGRMTPALLQKIKELVSAGATVVGPKPTASPSLANYPACDAQVATLASEVWGDCDGKRTTSHRFGKGRVFWGLSLDEVFRQIALPPDFHYSTSVDDGRLDYIHRRVGAAEVYFVCSQSPQPLLAQCQFRVAGKAPELWDPDTGRITRPAVYAQGSDGVAVPIHFDPSGSVFVVFRQPGQGLPIQSVRRGGETLLEAAAPRPRILPTAAASNGYPRITDTFTVSFWAKPTAPIELPAEQDSGIFLAAKRRLAIDPRQGEIAYGLGHASAGLSVGVNGVCVFESSARYYPAILVCPRPIDCWTHLALVYRDKQPRLYINGQLARTGLKSAKTVHPDSQRGSGPSGFSGEMTAVQILPTALADAAIAELAAAGLPEKEKNAASSRPIDLEFAASGEMVATVCADGSYEVRRANGSLAKLEASGIPAASVLEGSWAIRFPAGNSASEATFNKLMSWSEHSEPAIKFFSGTARYRKALDVAPQQLASGDLLWLDLGQVMHVAQVRLNGKELGTLWKSPYRLEITAAARPGRNELEIDVTNTWQNRLIGDEQLPDDYPWTGKGFLADWPKWLTEGTPRPEPRRRTFTTWKHFDKDSPLEPSGLLGPVMLHVGRTQRLLSP